MKKFTHIMMFAAVAAAALVSCNKETEAPEKIKDEGIRITVVAGDAVTKTTLSGTNKTAWVNGVDKVGFINGTTGVNVESSAASVNVSGQATFTGTVPAAGTYYAYYPYFNDASYGPTADGVTVRIPNTQAAVANNFDPAADVLVSEAFTVDEAGSYSTQPTVLRFRRLTAFLKVTLEDATTGNKLSGQKVTSVAVQGANNLVGRYRVHGVNGLVDQKSGFKKVIATYAADFNATSDAAYLGIAPQTLANGSALTITVETGSYTITKTVTLTSDVVIGAGDVLPIKVKIKDQDLPIKVTKLWEKMSTASINWLKSVNSEATAGSDFNIAIDDTNVYIPEFGSSKKIWAIDIATGSSVKSVKTSAIESTGYNGSIYLSCARVVKKTDGTPVLLASNLFQDGATKTGRLYVWDNGIDNDPRVVTLNQWKAGRRLGDTFTTYGNYEDCWLLMGTQEKEGGDNDGFVTFKVPVSGNEATLISRLETTTTNFCSYYPVPGDITKGMFAWRGGTHDDGMTYRNRMMTVASTESAIKSSGAHTATLTKLTQYMDNAENNNGSGFNFIEFGGRRYVIWVINMADSKTFDLVIKSGSTSTDWETIINTPIATITAAGGYAKRFTHVGGMETTWKQATDCAVWNNGDEVYIAVNKINVGLAIYKMSLE